MSDETQISRARGEPDDYVRLSAHPRAQRSIARAKAFGGLVGFLIGLWLGSRAGLPAWDTGVRALAGGIAGYVLVWVAAVQVWRQLVLAEYRRAEKRRERGAADPARASRAARPGAARGARGAAQRHPPGA